MAEILSGPWTERQMSTETMPDQFKESQQFLLKPIIKAQQELRLAARLFQATGDIRPIHCRKLINVLENIATSADAFCKLLSTTEALAIFISAARYPLLTDLHRLRQQATQAIILTEDYSLSYKTRAYHAGQKRLIIYKTTESILKDLDRFLEQLNFLQTEMRFQEKTLSALTEEVHPHLQLFKSPDDDCEQEIPGSSVREKQKG
jgi:hypothetical protein